MSDVTELPETWDALAEWLRFPGREDDVEGFLWDLSVKLGVTRPSIRGPLLPASVDLERLIAALVHHYGLNGDEASTAADELRTGLERTDLEFGN